MDALIIEDELLFAEDLKTKLESLHYDIHVKAIITSVTEGIEWFSNNPEPDVIFSDILLSDGLSLDLFKSENVKCPIIFTTAYNEYAIQVFEFNSIQYLLKPVKEKDLILALEKLSSLSSQIKSQEVMSLMEIFKTNIAGLDHQTIFVSRNNGLIAIDLNDVTAIKSEAKEAVIYYGNGKEILVDDSLKELEKKLNPIVFKRISRQWIVNIHSIIRLTPKFFGGGELVLQPNLTISLSRDKYHEVIKLLKA